jgi:hypothetical protein
MRKSRNIPGFLHEKAAMSPFFPSHNIARKKGYFSDKWKEGQKEREGKFFPLLSFFFSSSL